VTRRLPSASSDDGDAVSSEAIVDALPHGVLVLDATLRVRRANPRYCELLATTPEETLGRELFELSGGLWGAASIRTLVERSGSPDEASSVDLERPPAAAGARALRVHVRRLAAGAAEASSGLLFVVENRAPLRARDAATEITGRVPVTTGEPTAGDDLVARASHELRGPFGSIANWVHLLSESAKDAALVQQGLAAIQRAVKAGSQIVDDLHDLAQLRSGRLRLSSGLVDLASILETALDRPRAAALEKGVTLEVRRDVPSLPVMGDPIRLQQILLHLVTNAVKFTPAGGRVDVLLGREGANWRVSVSDTGRGVPEHLLPRIFDGLRQPGGSAPGSLGVGLAIVRHLAVLHGGSVEASSAGPGQGSRFVLRLPVPALAPSRTPTPPSRSATPRAGAPPGPNDSTARVRSIDAV
jgi:two-component system, chemotaxis family, CheB/CheR fusion protein